MAKNIFNNAPFTPLSNDNYHPFPGNKGLLLFYDDGGIKELYGREHVMMMQDIGYWYIDNWQDFMLNYSYNGIIVMIIEFNTSLLYLPKYISEEQKKSLINYINSKVLEEDKRLLKFGIMHCLEFNNKEFHGIERNSRGMIREIKGEIITDDIFINYYELCDFLNNNIKEYKLLKQ